MIILILAFIGLIAGVVVGIVRRELVEVYLWGLALSAVGLGVGVLLCIIADIIPFEEEEYLAYTTEIADFEPIGKDEDTDRIIYRYTDRNGIPVEFKPSQRRVTMNYANEDFRIETYKSRFTNKHVDYLLPSLNKGKYHIIYREAE